MKKKKLKTIQKLQQNFNAQKHLIEFAQTQKIKGGAVHPAGNGVDNDCDGMVDD